MNSNLSWTVVPLEGEGRRQDCRFTFEAKLVILNNLIVFTNKPTVVSTYVVQKKRA